MPSETAFLWIKIKRKFLLTENGWYPASVKFATTLILSWVRALNGLWLNCFNHIVVCLFTFAWVLRDSGAFFLLWPLCINWPFPLPLCCPAFIPRHWRGFSCALSVSPTKVSAALGKDLAVLSAVSQYLDQGLAHSSEWTDERANWGYSGEEDGEKYWVDSFF